MPVQYNPTDSRILTVAQSRTNNGQKDIRIILDIPTNDFYSLDDDGNFNIIGVSGGTQDLSSVLSFGNTSGANDIVFDASQGLLFDNSSRLREGTIVDVNSNKGIAQICGAGYELKWASGVLYSMNNTGSIIYQSSHNITSPTVNDDDTLGYQVGSYWMLSNNFTYICSDATTGAAVWDEYCPFQLRNVLATGNFSPDGLRYLNVNDTEASLKYDNLTNIVIKAEVTDLEARLEHSTSPAQIQSVWVDGSSANMRYQDGINIVDVELGLTNGFIAVRTNDAGDYENYIQVQFDRVNLVYNDIPGGINHELSVDADGYYLKNLPAFQDDTAASGLTAGYLYQTTGTGASPLDVAGILMIKQ